MRDRHVDSRWTDFPNLPDESAVWNWLSRIQDKYLTEARGIYYKTSTPTESVGGESQRQLDLFIKRRTDTVDTSHDWKDVQVIGKHRVSLNEWKKKLLQIIRYVRDVFSVQPTRRFVHAFTLFDTTIELWVFDRSGPDSSGAFDIHDKPENFIRALMGYTLMSDDELGLDSFTEHDGQDNSITIHNDTAGKEIKIQLEQQPMVIQRAIVCRGTTCYRSKDGKQVVKLSCQVICDHKRLNFSAELANLESRVWLRSSDTMTSQVSRNCVMVYNSLPHIAFEKYHHSWNPNYW